MRRPFACLFGFHRWKMVEHSHGFLNCERIYHCERCPRTLHTSPYFLGGVLVYDRCGDAVT